MSATIAAITPDMLDAVARRMQSEPPFSTGDVVWWLVRAGAPDDRGNRGGPTHEAAARLVLRERQAGRIRFECGRWVRCG